METRSGSSDLPLPDGVERFDQQGELERTKSQLLVFAREISAVYQRERKQSAHLASLMDELRTDYLNIVQTLALVVEAKDEYTRYHLERCRDYGVALTESIAPELNSPELHYGFLLHDIGKIGVPEAILSKTGPLSNEEMRLMRTHPLIGVQIIAPMKRILSDRTIEVVRHHHERFDGSGYPDKLRGEEIPMSARIFAVVDAFDAMTTDRPYRRALPVEEAIRRLDAGSGYQFDPEVVGAFTKLMAERAPAF